MDKCDLKTLGDLTEGEMERIERDIENQMPDHNVIHRSFQNGIETFVDVKYFDPNRINTNGEQVVRSCQSIQEEKSGNELERVPEESLSNIQEDEKRPF